MRKLLVASMLALTVMASACKEPDPNKFETHIERIKDADKRPQGFSGLETLVKTVSTAQDNADLLQEFADKVVPVFEEVWDEAKEQQPKMLQMCLDIGHPGCAPVWNKAIMLDGSAEARDATLLALEGVKKAKADGSLDTVIAQLEKLIADPKNDDGERAGEVRGLLVDTLGAIGSPKALPVLISSLEQSEDKQPVGVHRKVAEALGVIGDASATDALLTATYRVPDAFTSTNIGEKVKIALASIGEPAVPRVVAMLKAEHDEVQKLAAKAGLDQVNVQNAAASFLGVIGSKAATADLVAYFPNKECATPQEDDKKKKDEEEETEEGDEEAPVIDTGGIRAVTANALGLIGDEAAVDALCSCSTWSKNPGDMFPIGEALGRIGGPKATACLENMIKNGVYAQDAVDNSDFVYEVRWESARFGVQAAGAEGVGAIKAAIAEASKDANVAKNTKSWETGIATLEKCATDAACYQSVLDDPNGDWFAREIAALNLARMSMGDEKVAESISKAFKVRNPDARATMAWLAGHVMQGKPCAKCADEFERILDDEKDSRPPKEYQLSVLMARYAMGKLRPTTAKGGGGGG
ncbi:HEAT repeat domain-containing protein [Paraliomyxa miuraensis]|uniref:HEAT repeat domain-containing protein n=1 Tax=Paraliomyxa miuraensis TaxID=376150 RepID=UPI00224CDE3D|nr:HEAT repeat domain-containing protein [Paraliomyxa miuraensis]MCX4245422.1 HEAT repeat domain-containing protein [Paraliomyxa miuraensis]